MQTQRAAKSHRENFWHIHTISHTNEAKRSTKEQNINIDFWNVKYVIFLILYRLSIFIRF